jgi:hypothetical protein
MTNTNPGRLTAALIETADDMHLIGVMDAAVHEKVTLRHFGDARDIMPVRRGGNVFRITEPGKREPG